MFATLHNSLHITYPSSNCDCDVSDIYFGIIVSPSFVATVISAPLFALLFVIIYYLLLFALNHLAVEHTITMNKGKLVRRYENIKL